MPTVSTVLKNGNLNERWEAALVLSNIATPAAKDILREHLKREPDSSLRDFVERALGS